MNKNTNFSDDERGYFYNAILNLDSDKEFVVVDKDSDTLSYTKRIKSEEAITGRPGDDDLPPLI